jgi:anti-sigma B factor antagonist
VPTNPRAPLLIATHITGTTAVVSVRGDLDVSAAAELAEVLAQIVSGEPRRFVFDMAHAGFLDCFAAHAMLAAAQSVPGGRLVIRSPRPIVRRLLELTGLDTQCILEERLAADPGPGPAAGIAS